ncbi:MAG: hypothetical protein LBT44_06320 [Clostridiales bacterium]|nr:hypothetical protein [Clostridiales bacterium]
MEIKYKKTIWMSVAICAIAIAVLWMNGEPPRQSRTNRETEAQASAPQLPPLSRSVDFSGLVFTEWDYKAAAASVSARSKKPYTIMVYMNGSDLESEEGMATADLAEMIESGMDSSKINLILFTGGTSRWQNDVIPENGCSLWELDQGDLRSLAKLGLLNMGDPGTLAGFINFGVQTFPADKYGLILWDHGGGAIAGYGQDENFDKCNLTLLDMNYAFAQSAAAQNKLEFLGFDSCLMATVEMAVVASEYARYLVASEDLEPSEGWDYQFLKTLSQQPEMDGAAVGKTIVDFFMRYYGQNTDENLTLSVADLSQAGYVMNAMGNLMEQCGETLPAITSFRNLARKRVGTKTFGEGSPRDNQCDMVDIGDMADKLRDLYPQETQTLLEALNQSVVYSRHNSDANLRGLSAYYIYGGKDIGAYTLNTYSSMQMSPSYTRYQRDFYARLQNAGRRSRNRSSSAPSPASDIITPSVATESEIVTVELTAWRPVEGQQGQYRMIGLLDSRYAEGSEQEGMTETDEGKALWPHINGTPVCLYRISGSERRQIYAAPAMLNGRACDIIVLISSRFPTGKVLGARQNDGLVIQKGHDELKKGDQIAFCYRERDFLSNRETGWANGETFTVGGEMTLQWEKTAPDMYTSLLTTDIYDSETFGPLKRAQTQIDLQ